MACKCWVLRKQYTFLFLSGAARRTQRNLCRLFNISPNKLEAFWICQLLRARERTTERQLQRLWGTHTVTYSQLVCKNEVLGETNGCKLGSVSDGHGNWLATAMGRSNAGDCLRIRSDCAGCVSNVSRRRWCKISRLRIKSHMRPLRRVHGAGAGVG